MWRKGNLCALLVGTHIGAATVESSMELPTKINRTTFYPAIPLMTIYLKKPKTLIQKNTCTTMFTAAVFTMTKIWKQSKYPSVDEWIKQLWDIYIMEYYSAIKKKKILPFATAWKTLC